MLLHRIPSLYNNHLCSNSSSDSRPEPTKYNKGECLRFATHLRMWWFGRERGCLPVPLFISRIFHRHKSRDRRQASGEHSVAMVPWHPDSSRRRGEGWPDQNRGFNPVGGCVWETGKVNKSFGGLKIILVFCNIALRKPPLESLCIHYKEFICTP